MSVQTVEGEPLVFTPLAVDENPNTYLRWATKFPTEVKAVLQTLSATQGLSLTHPNVKKNAAVLDAVASGVLMPVEVGGATGSQRFLFAPRGGLSPDERTILDKARAIVACVRYGQDYAAGRRIRYPRRIIEVLADKKRFRHGHPDLFSQYGLLVEKLIGHPVDEGGGRWNFQVDDTAENMKALAVAVEMLEHGESPSARIDLEAQRALLSPSGYQGPGATRVRLTTNIPASSATRAEMIRQMARLARGMGSHE